MTHEDVFDLLTEAGIPVAYSHFEKDEENPAPEPPFICFYYPGSDDLMADNLNYATITPLTAELYTNNKDFALEAKLEAIFRRYELPFGRSEAYISKEQMYQITYNTEVLINAEQS